MYELCKNLVPPASQHSPISHEKRERIKRTFGLREAAKRVPLAIGSGICVWLSAATNDGITSME